MPYVEEYTTAGGALRWRGVARNRITNERESRSKHPVTGEMFADEGDALTWATIREREMAEFADSLGGEYRVYRRRKGATRTVGDYADKWLAEGAWIENTRRRYGYDVAAIKALSLGGVLLSDVRRTHIKAALNEAAELLGWDDTKSARMLRMTGIILREAVGEGVCDSDPTVKVDPPRNTMPRAAHIFTHEQMTALADAMPEQLRPMVLVGYYAGLRIGEVRGLTGMSVDLDGNDLRVDGQVGDDGKPRATKGKERRAVPMRGPLREALAEHVRGVGRSGYVFSRPDGRPLTLSTFYPHWRKARDAAGLPDTVTYHDLRHTFCTHLAERRLPMREIAALAGHGSDRTTMRYVHRVETSTAGRRAIESMDAATERQEGAA